MSAVDIASVAAPKAPPKLYLARRQASFERVPSLDGLRAVSIFIVMLSHFVDSHFFPGGLGVQIFFVVSGFLISRLMLAELKTTGRVSLRKFYLRRFFRLYPVVTVYAAAVVVFFALSRQSYNLYEPASALFYFANYLYTLSSMPGHAGLTKMPFGIFWSLSVEEHFYLLFPLLFVFLRGRGLVIWMAATCVVGLVLRFAFAQAYPALLSSHFFYYTDVRLDSIAFGVLLAALCETRHADRTITVCAQPWAVATSVALIFLCMAVRNEWFRETLRYTLLGVAITVLVAAIVFSPRYAQLQAVLNLGPVRWIGVLSYSIYVWHTLVPLLLQQISPTLPKTVTMPCDYIFAFALAALSYYLIEKPVGTLRHRFGSRPAT